MQLSVIMKMQRCSRTAWNSQVAQLSHFLQHVSPQARLIIIDL